MKKLFAFLVAMEPFLIAFTCLIIIFVIVDKVKFTQAEITFRDFVYDDTRADMTFAFKVSAPVDSFEIKSIHYATPCVSGTLEENASEIFTPEHFKVLVIKNEGFRNENYLRVTVSADHFYYTFKNAQLNPCELPEFLEIPFVYYTEGKKKETVLRSGISNCVFKKIG